MADHLKIGDKTPWPSDIVRDPQAIRIAMSMRGRTEKTAARGKLTGAVNRARSIMTGASARDRRAADQSEAAATFLRRAGFNPVFDRSRVSGLELPRTGYQVGRHHLADVAALISFAAERGFAPAATPITNGDRP